MDCISKLSFRAFASQMQRRYNYDCSNKSTNPCTSNAINHDHLLVFQITPRQKDLQHGNKLHIDLKIMNEKELKHTFYVLYKLKNTAIDKIHYRSCLHVFVRIYDRSTIFKPKQD